MFFSPLVENEGRCNKPVKTIGGGSRGFCVLPFRHSGRCGNHLCTSCGLNVRLSRHRWCRDCQEKDRRTRGLFPPKRQKPGELWIFACGCQHVLPLEGESNKFIKWQESDKYRTGAHYCRIAMIISSIGTSARQKGYAPIDPDISHSVIRGMMESNFCFLCCQPMAWDFGVGTTPALHHDHMTGEALGFAHSNCNIGEMITEINSLREELLILRQKVKELKTEVLSDNTSTSTISG